MAILPRKSWSVKGPLSWETGLPKIKVSDSRGDFSIPVVLYRPEGRGHTTSCLTCDSSSKSTGNRTEPSTMQGETKGDISEGGNKVAGRGATSNDRYRENAAAWV